MSTYEALMPEHGRYLCETCQDTMTDRLITVAGKEQAQCCACGGMPQRVVLEDVQADCEVTWLPWDHLPHKAQQAILYRMETGAWPEPPDLLDDPDFPPESG